MHKFVAYSEGKPVEEIDLGGARGFGSNGFGVRMDLVSHGHVLSCATTEDTLAGVSLLWSVSPTLRTMLSTTRLPKREQPYILNVELARGQILQLFRKREEWELFDLDSADQINQRIEQASALLGQALGAEQTDPVLASTRADKALTIALEVAEEMARFHGEHLTAARNGTETPPAKGVCIGWEDGPDTCKSFVSKMDVLRLNASWANVEPMAGQINSAPIDAWIGCAATQRIPLQIGPLVSFMPETIPPWLTAQKPKFKKLKELALAHTQRMVERYASSVSLWIAVSGFNAANPFGLEFEQIHELARLCCARVKAIDPEAKVAIELTEPFSEYYACDPRTIPTNLYAEVTYQSETKFDAFCVQMGMGIGREGYYVRDLLQISSMLDGLVGQEKPIHLVAGVPAAHTRDRSDIWAGLFPPARGGMWHGPWDAARQNDWLCAVYKIAASKEGMASFSWCDLIDRGQQRIAHGGLLNDQGQLRRAGRTIGATGLGQGTS
jgi:hypothetical protein